MTDVIKASGRLVPPAKSLTFRGWITYNPKDPTAWPYLIVTPVVEGINTTQSPPTYVSEGHVVSRVEIEIPVVPND